MALGRRIFRPIRSKAEETPISVEAETESESSVELMKHQTRYEPESCREHFRRAACLQKVRKREKQLEKTYGQCLVEGGIPLYSFGHVESKFLSQSLILPIVTPRAKGKKSTRKPASPPQAVYQVKSTAYVYDGDEIRLDDIKPLPQGSWLLATKLLYGGKPAWLQLFRGESPSVFYILAQDAPSRVPAYRTNMFGAVKQNISRAAMHHHELALSHALVIAQACPEKRDHLVELAEKSLALLHSPRSSPKLKELSLNPTTLWQCFRVFSHWAKVRFGCLATLWVQLDPDRDMRIGKTMFFRNCRRLGFTECSLQFIWRFLDRSSDGMVTIFELVDPKVTSTLVNFLRWLRNDLIHSSYSIDEIVPHFGAVDSRIQMKQLMEAISKRYSGNLDVICSLANLSERQVVASSDFAFMGRIRLPEYLSVKNIDMFQYFRAQTVHKYGSTFVAWQKMDSLGIMRVCWKSFRNVFNDLMNDNAEVAAGVWRCMDPTEAGWASLFHFDRLTYQAVRNFRDNCTQKSGSIVKHLKNFKTEEHADSTINRQASFPKEMANVVQKCGISEKETASFFKYLDDWDVVWEDSMENKLAVVETAKTRRKVSITDIFMN